MDPHSFPSWIRIQEGKFLENKHKNAGKFVIGTGNCNFIKIVRLCRVRILLSNLFLKLQITLHKEFFLGSKEHYK